MANFRGYVFSGWESNRQKTFSSTNQELLGIGKVWFSTTTPRPTFHISRKFYEISFPANFPKYFGGKNVRAKFSKNARNNHLTTKLQRAKQHPALITLRNQNSLLIIFFRFLPIKTLRKQYANVQQRSDQD